MKDDRIPRMIEDFRQSLELQGKSETTVRNYTSTTQRFLVRTGKPNSKNLTKKDIDTFLSELKEQKVTNRSLARHAYALKAFLSFSEMGDLAEEVPVPRYKFGLPKYLKKGEVRKIIDAAVDIREKTIFTLAYYCALRRSEVCEIKLSDVDYVDGYLTVHGKGGYEDKVPIDEEALKVVKEWMDSGGRRGGSYLFEGYKGRLDPDMVGRMFKGAAKRAGLRDASFHILRHSRATHLVLDGVDLTFVNKLLRHRRLDSSAVYLHVAPKQLKRALASVKKLEEEAET